MCIKRLGNKSQKTVFYLVFKTLQRGMKAMAKRREEKRLMIKAATGGVTVNHESENKCVLKKRGSYAVKRLI